tara:strand:- start:7636 stop:8211 length:576 start_codon:yes stop_codon:yes gene_type:complete
MSDERKIKSLMKQAQKMVHSSPRDSVAQKLAKRRSIILRGAQKDNEKGKDSEMEFGESTEKVKAPKGFHFMKHGEGKYKLMKDPKGGFKPHEGASQDAEFDVQKVHTEGYGDSTPTSFGPFKGHEAKQAGKDRHGFVVYDLFKDGEKVSSGHTSRAIEKKMDQLKTESYFGRMESMGKKMGKMARRLGKEK